MAPQPPPPTPTPTPVAAPDDTHGLTPVQSAFITDWLAQTNGLEAQAALVSQEGIDPNTTAQQPADAAALIQQIQAFQFTENAFVEQQPAHGVFAQELGALFGAENTALSNLSAAYDPVNYLTINAALPALVSASQDIVNAINAGPQAMHQPDPSGGPQAPTPTPTTEREWSHHEEHHEAHVEPPQHLEHLWHC